MLYFKANDVTKIYSRYKHDWLIVEQNELLTEREIDEYQRMGYPIKYHEFTAIITSQKNVKIVYGVRKLIDENKYQTYNEYRRK